MDHEAGTTTMTDAGGGTGPVIVTPGDPRYPELITGDNQRWVGSPDRIHLVGSTRQVVDAVQAAVRDGLRIAVRSGGHCYEDFVSNPDVRVVVDMSRMDAVRWDDRMRAFAIEPGARLLDVYGTLYKGWGVTIPGGRCYSVGAGGHICGGGDGLMSRRFGLTVDHLYAVEVVVVDETGTARSVVATREPDDPNHDLWWAHTGGGGGNFGVITRYWMRSPGTGRDPAEALPRPPSTVLLKALSFPWAELTEEHFVRLVRNYGTWHEQNSAPDSPAVAVAGSISLNHRAAGSVSMFVQVEGDGPDADRQLTEFVDAIRDGVTAPARPVTGTAAEYGPMPHMADAQRIPWFHAVRFLGTNSPVLTNPTLRADHKPAYHRTGLTADELAVAHSYLTGPQLDNPNASLLLLPYGGAVAGVAPDATAVAHRGAVVQALYQSFWSTPAEDAANLAWVRGIYADVYAATGGVPVPDDHTDGCYINYPDTDLSDPAYNASGVPWHDLYYKSHYRGLQRVKARWDPRDVFRHAQSVRLPA